MDCLMDPAYALQLPTPNAQWTHADKDALGGALPGLAAFTHLKRPSSPAPLAPATLAPAPQTAPRYRSVLRLIEARFHTLFPDINRANKATAKLADLSEDMRILSLNAELLAGRSGNKGAAVRALTQYTRGLVHRLMEINESATGLRTLYGMSTATLRCLRHLRQIESASALLGSALQDGRGRGAAAALERARQGYVTEMLNDINGLTEGMLKLRAMIQVVDDVVAQAGSIATNIAAEAVSAQTREGDFMAVAASMRRYVEELRAMNDEAARGVRGATEACESMREIAAGLARQLKSQACA